MILPSQLLRQSLLLLAVATGVAVGFKGLFFAFSLAMAGLLGIANFFFLGRLVARLVAQASSGLSVVIAFSMKFFVVTGCLLAMLLKLDPAGVLVGFGVVLVTTTVRGALGAFAPVPGQ
jgi:hypothetical protein